MFWCETRESYPRIIGVMPRPQPSRNRCGPLQASRGLRLGEPRRLPGVKQAVSYGTRSETVVVL